ncbi:unnamed protein product [Paramecium pentaurelia]|uniref:Uncharacterized protein n=1 Tax=Paramecium pentaurelia TaxID=43138 RepID=A0A8S1TL79_9CILI|nr:unnamed protein product [Paramecium pentaurelia]
MAAKKQRPTQGQMMSTQGDVQSEKQMKLAVEYFYSKAYIKIRYINSIKHMDSEVQQKCSCFLFILNDQFIYIK